MNMIYFTKRCKCCSKTFKVYSREYNKLNQKGYPLPNHCEECRQLKNQYVTFHCKKCQEPFQISALKLLTLSQKFGDKFKTPCNCGLCSKHTYLLSHSLIGGDDIVVEANIPYESMLSLIKSYQSKTANLDKGLLLDQDAILKILNVFGCKQISKNNDALVCIDLHKVEQSITIKPSHLYDHPGADQIIIDYVAENA